MSYFVRVPEVLDSPTVEEAPLPLGILLYEKCLNQKNIQKKQINHNKVK